jgi:FkbM family methyltransferase
MAANILPGLIAEFVFRGQGVRFFVRNIIDFVQNAHLNGAFYEASELEAMERFLKPGGVFLDVGANIGNHAIFAAMFGGQREVILIEPNPEAIRMLRVNLVLNELKLDTSHLGVGLSDQARNAEPSTPVNNLGGTKMILKDDGPLRLVAGDTLFADRPIDFIKIDVEGQELAVLAGLEQTIAATRPPIFVEVDNDNEPAFDAWLKAHNYVAAWAGPRFRNRNFIVRPAEKAAPEGG